jgi:hypothetical protein
MVSAFFLGTRCNQDTSKYLARDERYLPAIERPEIVAGAGKPRVLSFILVIGVLIQDVLGHHLYADMLQIGIGRYVPVS